MLTRIQLNLLGRRTYLSSVIAQATAAQQSPIHLENRDDAGSGGAGQPQSGSMLFENADELANQPSVGAELETNRRYLTFVWWLMNRGWQPLRDRVEAAVRDVFGKLSPRDALTFDQFSSMVQKVRQKVESGPHPMATYQGATSSSRWLEFMLPPRELEHWVLVSARIVDDSADETAGRHETEDPTLQSHVSDPSSSSVSSPLLRRLLDETADLIDSPAFAHVTAQVLDAGFALLLDRKVGTGAFEFPPVDEEEQRPLSSMSTSMTASSTAALPRPAVVGSDTAATDAAATKAIPLARILPVVARQARVVGSGCGPGDPVAESGLGFSSLEPSSMMLNGHAMPQFQAAAAVPNEYLHAMDSVPGVTAFSAVVYSSNWENEIADDDWWSAPAENDRGAPKVDMGQGRAEQQERQQQLQQSQPRKPEASASASAADFESIWQQSTVRTL